MTNNKDQERRTNKSAEKRERVNERNRVRNKGYRTQSKTDLKKLEEFIEAGDKEKALEALREVQQSLDKAAAAGAIHRNKASRNKSRAMSRVNGIGREGFESRGGYGRSRSGGSESRGGYGRSRSEGSESRGGYGRPRGGSSESRGSYGRPRSEGSASRSYSRPRKEESEEGKPEGTSNE